MNESGVFFDSISNALNEFGIVATEFMSDFWSCLPTLVQTVIVSAFIVLAGGSIMLKVVSMLK